MPKNVRGSVLSGSTYVTGMMRGELPIRKNMVAFIITKPEKCFHGSVEDDAGPHICVKCVESWSWDYDLYMHRTGGGRALAEELGLDPIEAGTVLRYRDGYEKLIQAT